MINECYEKPFNDENPEDPLNLINDIEKIEHIYTKCADKLEGMTHYSTNFHLKLNIVF